MSEGKKKVVRKSPGPRHPLFAGLGDDPNPRRSEPRETPLSAVVDPVERLREAIRRMLILPVKQTRGADDYVIVPMRERGELQSAYLATDPYPKSPFEGREGAAQKRGDGT